MPTYTHETTEAEPSRSGLVAVGFVVVSLLVLYLPAGPQQQLASLVRGSILRPFVMTQEGLARRRVHAAETEVLQQQLDSLASVIADQATLGEENDRLRRLLDLSKRFSTSYVAASVIRPGTPGSESMFLLDAGARRGVVANTPVIMGRGLLGVVRESRDNSAVGMDWTHPEFRASAMTLDGAVYGLVQATQGLFREADRLLLDGIPFHQELAAGTVLVTSALGGVYPRGIPIGTVLEEAEARAGWRRSYWLRPFVSPGEATHVLLLLRDGASEDVTDVWSRADQEPPATEAVEAPRHEGEQAGPVGGPGS
jgi:rod shape-determining protein MreC